MITDWFELFPPSCFCLFYSYCLYCFIPTHYILWTDCILLLLHRTFPYTCLEIKCSKSILFNKVQTGSLFFLRKYHDLQFSCSVVSNSLQPQESQHTRPPWPSPTPGVYSDSCPSSWWCHPAISSSVIPFSSCPQSLPGSGSFPMNQLFAWGDQSIGVSASASVLPMNIQDWFPLG